MDPSKKYEDKISDSSGVYKSRNSASSELSNPYLTFSTGGPPPPVSLFFFKPRTRRDLGTLLDHLKTPMWTTHPPRPACYSPRRLGHGAYSELCPGPAVTEKQKFRWPCGRLGGVQFCRLPAWQGKLLAACAFFLASVLSPCVQNGLHCRLSMLTSCPRALPTHGNASPTSMPACGLWPLECYTMGMEEAPDAAPLIEEPGARKERCFESAGHVQRAGRWHVGCIFFVQQMEMKARETRTCGSPPRMGHLLSRVNEPR